MTRDENMLSRLYYSLLKKDFMKRIDFIESDTSLNVFIVFNTVNH